MGQLTSMTGFARADGALEQASWHWEIKSVNGRGLDFRMRLPPGLDQLEPRLRAKLQKAVTRGNLQIMLQLQRSSAGGDVQLRQEVLDRVVEISQDLQGRLGGELPSIEALMSMRGVLEITDTQVGEEGNAALETALTESFDDVLNGLIEMRRAEGALLAATLQDHLAEIERLTIAARDCPGRLPDAARARLHDQIARLLEASDQLDPDRVHAEAVLLATKADVQEEIDRLFGHIQAAGDLLAKGSPAGRKLEFLIQEFNREANTLCSKSHDSDLTRIGLELKAVIDRMREQVLNVE